jgi:thioredoxin reductase
MDTQPAVDEICFDFEGKEIRCRAGVSLAAALTDAHELDLRDAGDSDVRGVFCGMGVCQECRLTVNGQHGTRACMTPARESLKVSRHVHRPSAGVPSGRSIDSQNSELVEPDVLVIGAGPGGLIAASVAAESGAEVILLDERPMAGGQFYKQPLSFDEVPKSLSGDRQFADGRSLIERARRSGASLLAGRVVWGTFAPNDFAVFDGACSRIYRPKRTIVATGAYERGLPLPGWTLPGVMTTGAAQTMMRSYGVLPGGRVLIAGNGPLNLQVALELKRAGVNVVAVAELADAPGPASFMNGLRMMLSAPGLTLNGIRYLAALRVRGVSVQYGQGLLSIEKTKAGLKARVGRIGQVGIDAEKSYEVDAVCAGYGFQPNNEILRSLGCSHRYDENRGHLITKRNRECETSASGIYAIGDCCGLGGALAAREEGIIAGSAAAKSLGFSLTGQQEKNEEHAMERLPKHKAFQSALWQIFAAPRYQTELAKPETIICRCENVRLQKLEETIADGKPSLGTVKRRTRLGMGACQGRYCVPVAAAMIAKRDGRPVDENSFFAPQLPMKPIRIADILNSTNV